MLPLHGTYLVYGDGVMSEGSTPGLRNAPTHFLWAMNGRVRPAPGGWMLCKSGGDLDTIYARRNSALVQVVDIAHFASQGHNDHLMETDPIGSPSLFSKWTRNLDAFVGAHNGRAKIILIDSTLPSLVTAEVTNGFGAAVRAAQASYVAAIVAGSGTQIVFRDLSAFDPASMTPTSDTGRVHPDERGGWWLGANPSNANSIFSKINPLVLAASIDDIANDTAAKTWRGANLYTDYNLAGTAGGKIGTVTPTNAANPGADTGGYATNHTITNNLTNGSGVTVGVGKDTSPDPYDVQQTDVSGTAVSRGTIVQDRTSNFSLTGSGPGTLYQTMFHFLADDGAGGAPDGLVQLAAVAGSLGSIGSTGDPTNGVTGFFDHAIDAVVIIPPFPAAAATYPTTMKPTITERWEGGIPLDGRTRLDRIQVFQVGIDEVGVPAYTGDDTIVSASQTLRVTGTGISTTVVTAATVGAVRLDPGRWANGAADWSTCFSRTARKNGATWSGHTFASGWTDTWTGLLTAGDTIDIDVTMTNSRGSSTKTLTLSVV